MNAVTPAAPAHPLTPLVLQNESLLRAIASAEPHDRTPTGLAQATGRDASNVSKSVKLLAGDGLVRRDPRIELTAAGHHALLVLDRAAEPPRLPNDGPLPLDLDEVDLTADRMAPDPANPRRRSGLTDAAIEDMAQSIAEEFRVTGRGLITPPTVRPPLTDEGPWRINKGERRWRGWTLAIARGWIPAGHEVRCPIYRGSDIEALASALVENLQRSDLDNLEEAESFAALAAGGDTVARICERIGKAGPGGERYVQERLKVAREATAENKARYIASCAAKAEGQDEAQPYLWKDLRDSVKTPRHVTALERNPRLRLLVLEMAALNDAAGDVWDAEIPIGREAPGGVLDLALELGLVTANPWGTAHLNQAAVEWLAQQGFGEDAETADELIFLARAEELTGIGAASLPPGQWATDFLNTPAPAAEPGSALPADAGPQMLDGAPPPMGDSEPGEASGPASPEPLSDDEDDEEIPAHLRRLAGVRVEAPARPAAPATDRPTPAQHLILTELSWKITPGDGPARAWTRGAAAFGFHSDPTATAMAPRWLTFSSGPGGDDPRVTLTTEALAYLDAYYEGGLTAADLESARQFGGGLSHDAVSNLARQGRFATPWLNPPPDAAASEQTAAPPTPNLDPVVLMRAALVQLWTAAGDHYAASDAVMAATGDSEQAAEEDDRLAATALALQRALFDAAPFIPADVKAEREAARG